MDTLTPSTRLLNAYGVANPRNLNRRGRPYAYVEMSILVVNAFVRMRELIASTKDIAARVEKLERGHERAASVIEVLVEDIDRLAREVGDMKALPPVTKRKIGFFIDED